MVVEVAEMSSVEEVVVMIFVGEQMKVRKALMQEVLD